MPWLVTCEIKLFQNYFSLRRRPSEIILFQLTETRQAAVVLYISGDKTPPCLVPLPTVNELDLDSAAQKCIGSHTEKLII